MLNCYKEKRKNSYFVLVDSSVDVGWKFAVNLAGNTLTSTSINELQMFIDYMDEIESAETEVVV